MLYSLYWKKLKMIRTVGRDPSVLSALGELENKNKRNQHFLKISSNWKDKYKCWHFDRNWSILGTTHFWSNFLRVLWNLSNFNRMHVACDNDAECNQMGTFHVCTKVNIAPVNVEKKTCIKTNEFNWLICRNLFVLSCRWYTIMLVAWICHLMWWRRIFLKSH